MAVEQRIHSIRGQKVMIDADLAELYGVTQPRINDLLRGRISRFSLDALVNIAACLGRKIAATVDDTA